MALWYYYPLAIIQGSPEATALHHQTLLKSINAIVTKCADHPVTASVVAAERSELDNIHFPLEHFKRETRIKWNRQPDDWYTFGRAPLDRLDNREPTSESYHYEEVNNLALYAVFLSLLTPMFYSNSAR